MPEHRFPPPWSVDEADPELDQRSFIVRDANGQALAYVNFELELDRRSAAHLLTRDEARRIAANIAKVSDMLHDRQELNPDDEERTTSMGLFNVAQAYRLSAVSLHGRKLKVGHADSPVRLLYCHALELYLKALVRQKHSVERLKKKFRHNIKRLLKESEALGLTITDEDREVFSMIWETEVVSEARYIRTGYKVWPTLEALSGTCDSIRQSVGGTLRKNGVAVRL